MAIQSYKLGPGTLKFDGAGQDVSCQITKGAVVPSANVTTVAAIDVLCGEKVPEEKEVSYSWTLDFTLLQDLAAAGFVAWSWTNKGLYKSFEYIPNTVAARKVTGYVRIDPVTLGGDVKTRPTSDASYDVTTVAGLAADPVFAAV